MYALGTGLATVERLGYIVREHCGFDTGVRVDVNASDVRIGRLNIYEGMVSYDCYRSILSGRMRPPAGTSPSAAPKCRLKYPRSCRWRGSRVR